MTKLPEGPPARIERLLARWLPYDDIGRSMLGDLRQEHHLRLQAGHRAGLWYAMAALALIARYRLGRPSLNSGPDAWRSGLAGDAKAAWRGARSRPGLFLSSILTLAVGTAATTAMFSLSDVVLWRGLPYPDADRLVRIGGTFPGGTLSPVAPPLFRDWRDRVRAFSRVTGLHRKPLDLTDPGSGDATRIDAAAVSPDFGATFGAVPALGRWLSQEDDRPGAPPVVVLGNGIWQSRWGGAPTIVGRTIELDGTGFTVIGVLERQFVLPEGLGLSTAAVFVPLSAAGLALDSHDNFMIRVAATLAPGRTIDSARDELQALTGQLVAGYDSDSYAEGFQVQVGSLRDATVGDAALTLAPFSGAALFLLVIAIANVAHLMLARTAARLPELGVRLALGATRWRLARQVLVESLAVGLAGGAVGLGLASAGLSIVTTSGATGLPRLAEVGLDVRAFGFAAVTSVLAAVAFGLGPALFVGRRQLQAAVRIGDTTATASTGRRRLRQGLIVVETALALVLLIGVSLMVHSLARLSRVDPGFRTDGVTAMHLELANRYDSPAARLDFFSRLRNQLRARAGFDASGVATGLPFGDVGMGGSLRIDGDAEVPPVVRWQLVDDGFFETLAIGALPGGRVLDADDLSRADHVVVVNEAFARTVWPDGPAVGRRLQIVDVGDDAPWREVIGVVADFKQRTLRSEAGPEVYVPLTQSRVVLPSIHVVVRGSTDDAATLRDAVHQLDPAQTIAWVSPLDVRVGRSTRQERFQTSLFSMFGGVAWALALVGVYATVAQALGARTRELGIRAMLGASRRRLYAATFGDVLRSVGLGLGLGLAGAWFLTSLIRDQLFGISPRDPVTTGIAVLAFGAAALVAAALPVRRSTALSPLRVVRER